MSKPFLRNIAIAVFGAVFCPAALDGQGLGRPAEKVWTPIGRMDPAVIKESSGIVKSPKYEGIFWTHGDSGNPAALYAIKADGTLVAKVPVAEAPNLDWEDIAADAGFLYMGDIGNNYGWLRVRVVYQLPEPDPYAADIQPIKPLAAYRYKYPDQPFDAEALVVRGGHLYVIRKAGGEASAIYRLTTTSDEHPALTKVQTLPSAWVTGADLSSDGRFLVTVSAFQLCYYPVNADLTFRRDEPPRFVYYPASGQLEACCFDAGDVVLTSEQGFIYRITAEDIQKQTRFVAARP